MLRVILLLLIISFCTSVFASTPTPVDDLQIEIIEGTLPPEREFRLTWSAPIEDIYGNAIIIDNYKLYFSSLPYYGIEEGMLLTETSDTCFTFTDPDYWYVSAFFRVVAVGETQLPPLVMITIPAGTFTMGQNGIAEPEHEVTLTNDFALCEHEVTNGEFCLRMQWAYEQGLLQSVSNTAVTAHDKVLINPNHTGCEIAWNGSEFILEPVYSGDYEGMVSFDHPVLEVSWYGAACYCDWLSLQEGLTPFYNGDWSVGASHNPYTAEGYRLPTEAEWEYASRYNDNRTYPWGNETPDCSLTNFNPGEYCVGWTAPFGSFSQGDSQLGLHDMAGNLWEWVNDFWGDYLPGAQTNPLGPPSHPYPYRSFRGGSWFYGSERLPSAHRNYNDPANTRNYLSFRICRTTTP